jgi:deoxyhypusine synthase
LKHVKQMKLKSDSRASEIIEAMRSSGVLGAGRVARAADLLKSMFSNPNYTVALSLAGPVVVGGLRDIISDLVSRKLVKAIVSNGSNVTHDILEALSFSPIRGHMHPDDVSLRDKGVGRIGDIYVGDDAFKCLESETYRMLDHITAKKPGRTLGVYELLSEIGSMLKGDGSILKSAFASDVPIFCPGIYDSMLGFHLWSYSRLKRLSIDFGRDMDKMAEVVYGSKKLGAVILGGGMPKHFLLGASMLREGVDAAIQITMDRPEAGSLSGASLKEAISWRKAKVSSRLVTVVADFTIVFPIMVSYVLHKKKRT